MKRTIQYCAVTFCLAFLLHICANTVYGQTTVRYAKHGYSMRMCFDNKGEVGHVAYGINAPPESLGLEYPIGSPCEHIWGGGIWVGGILDTSTGPTPGFVRCVSTAYEGWAGPINEFFPGTSQADSIWKVGGRGTPRPAGWEQYWGNSIPRNSFSENDHYCRYDDYHINIPAHIPLRATVVQSSFVWSASYAEGVDILEYKIINAGVKQIDSAYVGFFLEGDVGPYNIGNYWQHNFTGYYPDIRTAFIHNPVDIGSTPVGLTVVHASRPLDSLRFAYQWWPGPQHPPTDAAKYTILASAQIDSSQSPANLSDTRFLISFGPFTLRPPSSPVHDTVVVVFAVLSGQNLTVMRQHAERARQIYLSGGQVSVNEGHDELPARVELLQNYPNPFNPITTIRFALPRSGHVRLSIFNIVGEEVAVLVDDELSGGMHFAQWDARGKSSGVYFYRLQAGNYRETKKLILLR